jgi:hypothetical protein
MHALGAGHLAGGGAEQDAHAALPQAGERLLERVLADAVEDGMHARASWCGSGERADAAFQSDA